MKRTKEELYQALTILQDECISHDCCVDCPLRKDGGCMLVNKTPEYYKIRNPLDPPRYSAFKEE